MFIVYGSVEIYLPYSSSLKDKRQVLQSIISRIRKRYNISISEVDHHDLWQRSRLGFSAVGKSSSEVDRMVLAIKDTLYNHEDEIEVTGLDYDYISC
ncbi:DUF503 domain-containing protein [Syntrophomonas erecta]